jgi:hypothetical protein
MEQAVRIGAPPAPPAPARTGEGPPLAREEDGARSFAFDELGMFGVERSPIEQGANGHKPPSPPSGRRGSETPAERLPSPDAADGGSPPDSPPDAPRAGATRLGPGRAAARHVPFGPQIHIAAGPAPAAEAPNTAFASAEDAQTPERGPGPGSAPRREQQRASGARLVLAEEDGRLRIAAAAPGMDGPGRALLRRLVRQILAERSLSLCDFHLNGAPLDADSETSPGGIYGARPD